MERDQQLSGGIQPPDTSVAGIRSFASALVSNHGSGAVASNARHHLEILADILSGTHRYWAGVCCSSCGEPLNQQNGTSRDCDDDIVELVCNRCAEENEG